MDINDLEKKLGIDGLSADEQMELVDALQKSAQTKLEIANQETIGKSTQVIIQGLKKIKSDLETRFSQLNATIESKASSLRDGKDGKDGKNGKDGLEGKQGLQGSNGQDGRDGRDGLDGTDGISVTSARIDFDGSLIIGLSSGVELNVGEVVAPDLAESIKVITNGGGTSQSVLDTLASLQTQIDNLIPSQTGNSGKYLTTNGTALSWASVAGGLSYQGTWNASTNTPTLASSTGTNGYYYIVATAGSTNLNGITDWQIGDWLVFNGSVWQKIDQSETLQFVTSTDTSVTVTTTGSTADLAVYSSPRLISQVRNETGATLTKGTVVYINGASGNKATVTKALASGDTTSAQTIGLIFADISNNNNGYAILAGDIAGLDTSAFAAGTQLYLSASTAGAYTSTKQYAPNHLVYVGVVTRSHVNQGSIEVRIQNGYELDELHNVSAQTPSNGHTIIWNATTSLWESHALTAGTAIGVSNGAGSITINNTGVTSAVAGTGISVSGATGAVTITNSAPDQTVALTGAGTTSITGTYPNFTITSNDAYTGTVTSVTGTSPVASSGGTTPAISLASGYGDTQNPYASKTANYFLAAPDGSAGVPTFRAVVAADIPTLNQNTTGTAANITASSNSTLTTLSALSLPGSQVSGNISGNAANVTGTVAIANGGTGQTTQQAALTALSGTQTSGQYLRSNGTNTLLSAIQAADIPTLNQNTTGTASNVTGTVAIANGGTGSTTATAALTALGAYPSSNPSGYTSNTGTVTSVGGTGTVNGLTLTGTVTTSGNITLGGTLSGIANSALTNSSVTVGTTAISLGSSSLTLGGLTSVAVTQDPTTSLQLATKQYVDNTAQGLSAKTAVYVATTANITLSGEQTIDGFTTSASRVLVKNQTTSSQNGIYVSSASSWTRATDADTWTELISAFVFVSQGTINGDTGWTCTVNAGGTLGTTAVTWVQFSGAGTYTAGTGLTLTGTQFSITNVGTANTYGSATQTPVFTTNAQGQVSSVTNTTITPAIGSVTGLGTGIATFLGTPTSANLATAVTDETGSGSLVFATSPTLVTPVLGTPQSGNFSTGTFTWPTFNQNTTGTASNVTGTVAIANGGTGQTTANTAFNALAPSQTSNSGKYLTTDGTNTSWATVVSGASISNDTTTSTNLYPLFAAATSGVPTTIYTGNTKYLYKPSTGELSAPAPIATNGILLHSTTVGTSYTIASGNNGMSVGPVTVASGQAVTISSGQRWLVL